MLACGGVDAGDGEGAVLAFLEFAVAGCVVEGVEHRLFGNAVAPATCGAVAFGGFQDRLVARSTGCSCFDSGHGLPLNVSRSRGGGGGG